MKINVDLDIMTDGGTRFVRRVRGEVKAHLKAIDGEIRPVMDTADLDRLVREKCPTFRGRYIALPN